MRDFEQQNKSVELSIGHTTVWTSGAGTSMESGQGSFYQALLTIVPTGSQLWCEVQNSNPSAPLLLASCSISSTCRHPKSLSFSLFFILKLYSRKDPLTLPFPGD